MNLRKLKRIKRDCLFSRPRIAYWLVVQKATMRTIKTCMQELGLSINMGKAEQFRSKLRG